MLWSRLKFRKKKQNKKTNPGGEYDSAFEFNNQPVGLFFPWYSEEYLPHPVLAEHVFTVIFFYTKIALISAIRVWESLASGDKQK